MAHTMANPRRKENVPPHLNTIKLFKSIMPDGK